MVVALFSHKAVLRAVSARTLNSKSASFGVRPVVDIDDSFLKLNREEMQIITYQSLFFTLRVSNQSLLYLLLMGYSVYLRFLHLPK
jgi:hypothetical protein